MMNKIDLLHFRCSSPKVIPHPSLKDWILFCDMIHFPWGTDPISPEERYAILDGSSVYKVFKLPVFTIPSLGVIFDGCRRTDTDYDYQVRSTYGMLSYSINNYYLVDSTSGEMFPLFLVVGCGKCEYCKEKSVMSLQQQVKFQFLQSVGRSVFVTLTYNDLYLPSDGVNKKHVQNFKKRFKQLVARCYNPDVARDIKYIFTSEYGHNNERPHYHGLIYGIPVDLSDELVYYYLMFCWRDNIRLSDGRYYSFNQYKIDYPQIFKRPEYYDPYSYGFINLQFVNSSWDASYIFKYQFKDDSHPVGKNPNFLLRSNNLGVDFVSKFKQSILDSNDGKLTYMDFTKNELKSVTLCSYYVHKLFPKLSDLLPSRFRSAFRDLHFYGQVISTSNDFDLDTKISVLNTIIYITDKFPDFSYHFIKVSHSSLRCPLFDKSFILNEFLQSANYLIDYHEIDMKELLNIVSVSDLYFQKLKYQDDILSSKKSSFLKSNKVLISKSKL